MKINEQLQSKLVKIYQQQKKETDRARKRVQPAGTDRVEISEAAKDLQRLVDETVSLPEIRLDRVRGLKDRIQTGAYQVPAEKLAAKMVENFTLHRKGDS